MIRAEELMIGDWVLDGTQDAQVTGITCDGIIETTANANSNIELLEPIPITPEILERNGFELKPDGWLWSNEGLEDQNYIFIQFRKGCESVRNCEINFIHRAQVTFKQLYFVHELQHALKLCGIPKNIEL